VDRFVLHVDLDQFIAAVEVLRRPDLRDVPVVVGGDGDPTKRGVVSTASYEARRFGIRSGMPLRTAARRCPEAVFLPVDAEAYHEASGEVMRTLRTFPAVVEVAGWDEAYLDVEAEDPEALAAEIQRAVLGATGLSCSVGIGDNKLRAKIASDMRKPGGVFRLTRSNWRIVMEGRPTESLWGIGRKTAGRLAEAGLRTVGDLARADAETLAAAFGPSTGPWLRSLAEGESTWKVSSDPHVAKGRGKERTYQQDIADREEVVREIGRLSRELADEIGADGRPVARVVVKVRFAPFFTHTHGVSLARPTADSRAIERGAMSALDRFELDRPVRLLGVRVEFASRPRR
jgi:DNA polymerase IV